MNQTRACPRCRHANLGSNPFCASCGAGLRGGGHAWKLLFGLFALLIGFVWGAALFNRQGAVSTEPLPPAHTLAPVSAAPAGQVAPLELTGAQHLARGQARPRRRLQAEQGPEEGVVGQGLRRPLAPRIDQTGGR